MEQENGTLENLNQDVNADEKIEGQDNKVEDQKYLNQKIRAERAEKLAKELEAKLQELSKEKGSDLPKGNDASLNRLDEVEMKVELRMEGYSKDEISFMESYAKGLGKKLNEVTNDPMIKKAIEGSRADKKAELDTPTPSSRTAVYKGKTINEIVTDPKSSKEDKQAAFEALVRSKKGGNKFN